jgi:hypothetical protein
MQKSDNHLDADMTMIRILEIDNIVEQIKSLKEKNSSHWL